MFEIGTAQNSTGYAGTPTVLATFDVSDGQGPTGSLIADANGDLFGTTYEGGASGDGTVFEIANTTTGYLSTPVVLVSFNGADGETLQGSLIADANGDLFGTTSAGGADGDGTVFEIAKTATGYASIPIVLLSFNGTDGRNPVGSLIADADGDLFGTTNVGGAGSEGTVFEIAHTAAGYASADIVLASFNGDSHGSYPEGSLIADANGDLFGTAEEGAGGYGTVFEITDSGYVACFCAGTRILTARGEVVVEALRVGEMIDALGSGPAAIKWIGYTHIACRRHPRPSEVWPVRVAANAFGQHSPCRDLLLSPDHAVFVDGSLIPVRYLINGATITQEPRDEVTYWHIELDNHDVILAEALPCESYLDTGNRSAFANGGPVVQMHPEFATSVWDTKACAPLVLGGPRLIAARQHLLGLAADLGCTTTKDPALCVVVAGRHVSGEINGARYRFVLQALRGPVQLMSRSTVPAHICADVEDHRTLGVAISRVLVDGEEIELNDARLSSGWHDHEHDGTGGSWRWTDGDAGLALACGRILEIEVAITARYWLERRLRTLPDVMKLQRWSDRATAT